MTVNQIINNMVIQPGYTPPGDLWQDRDSRSAALAAFAAYGGGERGDTIRAQMVWVLVGLDRL